MKKIFAMLSMALVAVAMTAQAPVITFEKTEHDFGKINEEGGRVSVEFVFKNEGMTPLVLSNVRASCGCTTPKWTREPVEPGQTGIITVTYNPNGRPGHFQKTVTITSNATEPTKKVYIKGEVIPKPAKPENVYKIAVGELSMKSKSLELGSVKKGQNAAGELEFANLTQAEHTVDLIVEEAALIHQTTLTTVKPNETGKFQFSLDTKQAKQWGPVAIKAYVVVDGKKALNDEYRLDIHADIVEDFSALSVEEKQQAPIIEVPEKIELGKVAAGKTLKHMLPIKNTGANPLEIRRAYSSDETIGIKIPKAIKSGKKGAITIEINAKEMQPGTYTRDLQIISNDYQNSVKRVKIVWTVE